MKRKIVVALVIESLLLFFAGVAFGQTSVDDGHQLCITSFPDGANVLLDGVQVQQDATHTTTPMCLNKIKVGSHQISVASPSSGWQTHTRTITLLDFDANRPLRDTHPTFPSIPTL